MKAIPLKNTAPRGIFPAADGSRFVKDASPWWEATGEYRPPNKGDWYLSGAIVQAYLSPATLSFPYWIARPVKLVKCPHCKGTGKVKE